MRGVVVLVVVLVGLCWCVPFGLASHHHRNKQPQDALSWLDASAHHHSNSPLHMSYRPDLDDKKDKDQDDAYDDDDNGDDDGLIKGSFDTRATLCRNYDCPNFNSTSYPTFTKRSYANVTVACTTVRTFAPWKFGEAEAFKRLYEYFGGENSGNTKINMTVPVVRYVQPGVGSLQDGEHPNVTVCFFLPDALSMNPPTPNNNDVHLIPSSFDVLIHPFEGFSTHENVGKALKRFQLILHVAGIEFDKTTYTHAAYTEPWILWPRYNEIWLMQGGGNQHPFAFSSHHHRHTRHAPGGPARYRVHHGHAGRN